MDEKVALWIINFLLRKPIDDKIINGALSSLPISDNDYRLKKTILLHSIESETKSNGSVSEKLLKFLEIIEELDHRKGKVASDLMKRAYCAVAVDCTVRFLEENAEENRKYMEAVERVWKARVCKMEGLISEESNLWLADIEAAVSDSSVCERILMRNTRNEALKAVRAYLKEAWKIMGPSFLDLVAMKVGEAVEELRCSESAAAQEKEKHVAVKTRHPRGAKISDATDEDIEQPIDMPIDVPTHMDKVQEALQSNSMQLHDAVGDPCPDAARAAHAVSFTKVADTTNNATIESSQAGQEIHAPPKVNRVQEALKTSPSKLHATVTDPLPEALHNTQTAVENKTGPEIHAIPAVNTVQQALKSGFTKEHVAVKSPHPSAFPTVKTWLSAMEINHVRPMQHHKSKRSLVEPPGSGHIFEWNDSIDNPCRDSHFASRLPPNPKKSKVSAFEDTKYPRRETKKWSPLEVDALKDGVRRFGKGKWKDIRLCYNDTFKGRTEVDLKDKWRNLMNPRS